VIWLGASSRVLGLPARLRRPRARPIGQFPSEREFHDWRRRNGDRGHYGAYHCPLAECLKDGGVPYPMVLERVWTEGRLAKDPEAYRPLPDWAIEWRDHYDQVQRPLLAMSEHP
jgi:hypothetical protein